MNNSLTCSCGLQQFLKELLFGWLKCMFCQKYVPWFQQVTETGHNAIRYWTTHPKAQHSTGHFNEKCNVINLLFLLSAVNYFLQISEIKHGIGMNISLIYLVRTSHETNSSTWNISREFPICDQYGNYRQNDGKAEHGIKSLNPPSWIHEVSFWYFTKI